MKTFRAILKNYNKFKNIKFPTSLYLSDNESTYRYGERGTSTEVFGGRWYFSPYGNLLFKVADARYGKNIENLRYFNEILAQVLATELGVKCAKYLPATHVAKEQTPGIASVSFLKKGEEFLPLNKFFKMAGASNTTFDFRAIHDALNSQELDHYKIDKQKIITHLYKMMVFDLLTLQTDRYSQNVGFIFNESKMEISPAPLFDNEFLFLVQSFVHTQSAFEDMNLNQFALGNFKKDFALQMPFDHSNLYSQVNVPLIDTLSKQIAIVALLHPDLKPVLENMLKKFDVKKAFAVLEKMGYWINDDYKQYVIQLADFSKTHLAEMAQSVFENSEEVLSSYDFEQELGVGDEQFYMNFFGDELDK